MEIRQLEALNAVVTSGSVTAAGRLLGRSQPVISRQVSDLEAELGFVLFERTRPTITLTEPGVQFYQDVRSILADLQQLESHVMGLRSGEIRPLRILATADLAHGLLPTALALVDRFNAVFPQKLILEEAVYEVTARSVLERRADFALINLPIDVDGLQVHWCGQAPCQLAMPASHPLTRQSMIHLEDIHNTDVITLLGRYRMRFQLINSLVQLTSRDKRRHIEVASQQTALSMVRAGLGVALIDPFSVHPYSAADIVLRPIATDIPYRIGVVSPVNHILTEGATRLIRGLYTHVRSTIPQFLDTDVNGLQAQTINPLTNLKQA
ncbi:LysR family transcriptional regulator [Castellaniella sp.]|uniref:LysR family transcriptional regulator n=1 Tax=Castellaniella sp. TaxID=1955812 RepID=UPI002AFE9C7E|nr:LysR family transcriptional regulator [Castellaniella sp.]